MGADFVDLVKGVELEVKPGALSDACRDILASECDVAICSAELPTTASLLPVDMVALFCGLILSCCCDCDFCCVVDKLGVLAMVVVEAAVMGCLMVTPAAALTSCGVVVGVLWLAVGCCTGLLGFNASLRLS